MISENIFRAYDIRGIYGRDFTNKVSKRIGKALAIHFADKGKTFLVGRDVRISSKSLGDSLIEGMLSGGLNVEDIGIVTTPILYWASIHYDMNGGVMVTASHNPPEWNGLKIWTENGFVAMGKGMEELKSNVLRGTTCSTSPGNLKMKQGVIEDYKNYVKERIDVKRKLKVITDPGNGSCALLTTDLFRRSGLDVFSINDEPDGTFPVHSPEPNKDTLNEVGRLVLENDADFGVGFDGDGDRVIFVDDKGRIVSSTAVFIILANYYLKKHRGGAIVYEVSCSLAVEEMIKSQKGKPILCRVGHTYIVDNMLREKAVFGGETSGHFYFADIYGFDDALYTSLKIAEVLSIRKELFSEIVDSLPEYPRIPSKTYECKDDIKFKVVEDLLREFESLGFVIVTIDGVKVISDNGWFLIRPSNTQPLVRLTVEARTNRELQRLTTLADNAITTCIKQYETQIPM